MENFKPQFNNKPPSPEERLGKFFDETEGKEYKSDGANEKIYQRARNTFIQEGLEQEDKNIYDEKVAYENRHDPVTGLKNRREFFKNTSAKIRNALNIPQEKKMDNDEWLDVIENCTEKFDDLSLYTMMSDISFLGTVNDMVGHSKGDILLKKITEVMKDELGSPYRIGGDEITAIFSEPLESVIKKVRSTQDKVELIPKISGLSENNLKPNIDIGLAKFSDGLEIFQELLKNNVTRDRLKHDALRNLEDTWLDIADKKAYINKAKTRIALLVDRKIKKQTIIGSLTKGIYERRGPEDDKTFDSFLESLKTKKERGESIGNDVEIFIKEQEIKKYHNITKEHEKIKSKLILKKVGIL